MRYDIATQRELKLADYNFRYSYSVFSRTRLSGGARASGAEKKRESGDSGHFTVTLRNGRVEICNNNELGTVCDDSRDNVDDQVVC